MALNMHVRRYCVHMWARRQQHLVLRHDCVRWVRIEHVCCYGCCVIQERGCVVLCYVCCISQERIIVSAVPMAPSIASSSSLLACAAPILGSANSVHSEIQQDSCHSLLLGVFPAQGLNPGLPHCRQILLPSEPPRKPFSCYFVLY